MTFSYYPGCTLKNKAKDLNEYGIISAKALGIDLEEIPEWQCCGGVYPLAKDEIATRLSSVRALSYAKSKNQDVVALCSACYHVLKRVNNDILTDENIKSKVNNYLEETYNGETSVIHYLEMLRDNVGFDKLKEAVKNPLTGKKIGAYYGCMLLRPSKVLNFDNPENPTIIEDFISAIGATPVYYAQRNECCGGYLAVENKEYVERRTGEILEAVKSNGIEMIITACPLCYYNLKNNPNYDIPVVYFTEILAEALGLKGDE